MVPSTILGAVSATYPSTTYKLTGTGPLSARTRWKMAQIRVPKPLRKYKSLDSIENAIIDPQ